MATTAVSDNSKAGFAAAKAGDRPALQSLLAAATGAAAVVNLLESKHGEEGETALMVAARHGHMDCMSDLMDAGASIEAENRVVPLPSTSQFRRVTRHASRCC